jgi:hypothetical protein
MTLITHRKTTSNTQNRINRNNSGRKSASGCFALFPFDVVVAFFLVPPVERDDEDVFFFVDEDELLLRLRPVPADAKTSFLLKFMVKYIRNREIRDFPDIS